MVNIFYPVIWLTFVPVLIQTIAFFPAR